MRALEGLAGCLCEQGRRTEAIVFTGMLRLNPADNQDPPSLLYACWMKG